MSKPKRRQIIQFTPEQEAEFEKRTKDYLTTSNNSTQVSRGRRQNKHLKKRNEEGATKAADWAKDHPVLNTVGLGLSAAPFAVATYPAAVGGGELLGTALANPYVDAGLTSVFGAHGLNHVINEGITDWKDGVMTALEVTPLGRLARPIWNVVKPTRNFVPTLESNMSGVRYAYNRNPELAKIGSLEDYNNYLKTVFPESKVKDINYHMGPKGLQELKPSTGEVYNTNPDARGIYVTPDKSYAQKIRKYTTDRLEKPSFFTYLKRNLIRGGWDKANDVFTDIYPVMVDTKNPLLTKGSWTWGIKDKKYQSLMHDYDAIVNSGPKWYQNFNSMPEIIVPKTEQSLILGSDADVAGFRRFMSDPQITAENAASITPEQWTALQDAAIVRGDMAEAQRLRDLHFRIYQKGDMIDVNGNPIHVYHGSPEENITEFYKPNDPRLPIPKGIDFKATGEEGIYTSPRKGYAANYMADLGGRYRIPLTKEQKALLKAGKTREEIGLPSIPQGRIYDLYSNTKLVPEDLEIDFNPFTLSTEEANLIKSKGYSGYDIPGKKHPEHVVLEPNQLKLADAVTFDDKGVRIPLGKRDNFKINDIRYGLLPFLGLGTASALYKKKQGGKLTINNKQI